ncbi:MAG: DUF1553 domain-containing protein, partial [Verrucomicrobiae bacterium]|nr:DUF1553 domain-containing protein [Verrucomicrobiae bacterium]
NLWGGDEFALSFWFRLDDLSDGALLSELDDPDDLRIGTVVDLKDGRLRFMLSHRWNYAVTWFELRENLKPGQWYHFAVTCDGQVQLLAYRAYLNGKAASINVIQDSAVDGKKIREPLVLGGSPLGPGFRGALDELRFQRRVLRPDEIGMLSVRAPIADLAKRPRGNRSENERLLLRQYFTEHAMDGEAARAWGALRAAERERKAYADSLPTTMVMRDERTAPTRMRVKGRFDSLGDPVRPDTPGVLPPMKDGLPRNRLGFARWLTDPTNPLTARVAVNRLWQHFFGRGFVDSPENFGTQCSEPIQLELLDWLATEFIRLEWDVKAMVRLIVTSETYRQSSSAEESFWREDPENRHLARGPRLRLSAPELRDQSLALAGLLLGEMGGEPVFPHQPEGLWRLTSNQTYAMSEGSGRYRRSLYTYWRRSIAPPTMTLFDAPGREFCNVGYRPTNTPLQALAVLNEHSFVEAARGFAVRMLEEGGNSDESRASHGFRLIFGRDAEESELAPMLKLLKDDRIPRDEAFVHLATLLLNLDKTLTKE